MRCGLDSTPRQFGGLAMGFSCMKKVGKLLLYGLGLAFVYVFAIETYGFLTHSESKAQSRAVAEFVRLCQVRCPEMGMKDSDFSGPILSATSERTYSFYWNSSTPKRVEVLVTVSYYWPTNVESWLIE